MLPRSLLCMLATVGVSVRLGASATAATPTTASTFGTLVTCSPQEGCLWAGVDGALVDGRHLRDAMVGRFLGDDGDAHAVEVAHRNLAHHMNYLEDVHTYAAFVGHAFRYQMGVNERHLHEASERSMLPQALVHREQRGRREMSTPTRRLETTNATENFLNWCDTSNPKGRSMCAAVKSQASCGSCWAFAASDAIETAVAIADDQTHAVALSPQQFLSCSTREMEHSFSYCWAANGVTGASWVSEEITWKSSNEGCNGGMTHGAFQDAAQLNFGLLTEISMPYTEDQGNGVSDTDTCVRTSNDSAASITGWEQVVGKDCSVSSNANDLLRDALQIQPIAVAINSADPFKDYAGGFYDCPNNGDLPTKDSVNHALLLVGYGTDESVGDYWILKNSYGSQWGESGFMKLVADEKINCGLNIFPVVPLGAAATANSVTVDGGGAKRFVGLSPAAWIAVAATVSAATVVATAVGVFVARKRQRAARDQASGATSYAQYN